MAEDRKEKRFSGVSVSEGVAIGTLFHLQSDDVRAVPEFAITTSEVGREIGRYRRALFSSRQDLEKLQFYLAQEGSSKEAISVIDSHIQMLEDPIITTVMEEKISQMLQNTESVFRFVIEEYKRFFEKFEDQEVHQRLIDVKDLSNRILKHLHPITVAESNDFPTHSIICAYELGPSYTAEASPTRVQAFVSEIGGTTSHAGLIARAKGIPYVSNICIEFLQQANPEVVIVDGNQGLVIVNPTKKTLAEYSKGGSAHSKSTIISAEPLPLVPETSDGIKIDVLANLERIEDLHLLTEYKVRGVGLLRSEFFYLKKELDAFSEEEQFSLYSRLFEEAGDMEITFRLFDIGSDKKFIKTHIYEPNPALGCRSIRFLMRYPQIFLGQMRALLRASPRSKLRILLPLISDIEELREVKALIYQTRLKLIQEGHDVPRTLSIGCMVEVPAFVIMCDHLAKECDFLSIGTNDLIQYTLAADRSNPETCDRYNLTHPSILRMIKMIVDDAKKANIPVSLCGEVASSPLFAPLLIGLGLRSLSCSPRYIPLIKQAIAQIDSLDAAILAEEALSLPTASEVHQLLTQSFAKQS